MPNYFFFTFFFLLPFFLPSGVGFGDAFRPSWQQGGGKISPSLVGAGGALGRRAADGGGPEPETGRRCLVRLVQNI